MMTMTMRLKFAGTSADEGFTDIFWKPLNLKARGNVLEERNLAHLEPGDVDVRTQELRTEAMPAWGPAGSGTPIAKRAAEGFVEQDALSEMLEEMSLSTLLYYVLAGEGTDKNESS
jgi:hypothetical protein